MKIGVSSYSFSRYMKHTGANYLKICDLAREMGFDGIEFIDLDLNVQPAESVPALAAEIRAHCDSLGLPVAAYTVHADFIDGTDEVERLKRQVDVAQILGAPVMRHDVTWRRDIPWREIIDRTAAGIREVAEYAQSKGVRTCTENHGYVLQDANRVEALILAVNHPNYGWLVDMGNFLCADEAPEAAVGRLAPYAFHAHAKDFLYKPCTARDPGRTWFATRAGAYLRGTVIGHGVVPVEAALRILQRAGFDDVVAIEFEGVEPCLEAVQLGYENLQAML